MDMQGRKAGIITAIVGAAFAAFVAFSVPHSPTSHLLLRFSLIVGPWLALSLIALIFSRLKGIWLAGCLMLAYEGYLYYAVFVAAESSTDALAYILKPAIQLLFLAPLGIGINWVARKGSTKP